MAKIQVEKLRLGMAGEYGVCAELLKRGHNAMTLTTVGYGDLCPATDLGRLISMFSSLFGVAVIALPSGIITASYLDELRSLKEGKKSEEEDKQ